MLLVTAAACVRTESRVDPLVRPPAGTGSRAVEMNGTWLVELTQPDPPVVAAANGLVPPHRGMSLTIEDGALVDLGGQLLTRTGIEDASPWTVESYFNAVDGRIGLFSLEMREPPTGVVSQLAIAFGSVDESRLAGEVLCRDIDNGEVTHELRYRILLGAGFTPQVAPTGR